MDGEANLRRGSCHARHAPQNRHSESQRAGPGEPCPIRNAFRVTDTWKFSATLG
jgi:hypothetical protein